MPLIPRVSRRAKGGSLRGGTHGEFIHICLPENDGPGLFQTQNSLRAVSRNKVSENPGRAGSQHPFRAHIVLDRHRNTCQRPCQLSPVYSTLDLFCLSEGSLPVQRHITVQSFFLFFDDVKDRLHGLFYSHLFLPDCCSQFHSRHMCQFHGNPPTQMSAAP